MEHTFPFIPAYIGANLKRGSATNRQNYKLIAIFTAMIAAGVPLWTSPARSFDFTDPAFIGLWLLIGVIVSFTTLLFINLKTQEMVGSFASGYVLAVITHFVGDILINSYVHTQLSFSLLIALGAGVVCGWSGSMLWRLVKRKRK